MSVTAYVFLVLASVCQAAPTRGVVTEKTSFTLAKAPSGMFYDSPSDILYVLCGTQTNGDHYLYAYTTGGTEKCLITIPQAVGMSRVDGFQIVGSDAYIVDSQGPIYATTAGKLGGSVYKVVWTNPCTCSAGSCSSTTATWSPTVSQQWELSADNAAIGDGGGVDAYFRNSGIVVSGTDFYGVNGVHPVGGSLTGAYPKSLVKVAMADTSISQKWSFTGSTIGHDVDMEGLTCGADECATYMYIGDEYNYIYQLTLATSDAATAVEVEWDLNSIVGNVNADKGIESLTYASTTGYFYAGIQDSSTIHVVELTGASSPSPSAATPAPANAATPVPTAAMPAPATPAPANVATPVPTAATPAPANAVTPVPTAAPTNAATPAPTAATPAPTAGVASEALGLQSSTMASFLLLSMSWTCM